MKHFLSIVSVGVICVIFLAGGRRLAEDPHNRLVGFTPRPDEEESIESCLRGHLRWVVNIRYYKLWWKLLLNWKCWYYWSVSDGNWQVIFSVKLDCFVEGDRYNIVDKFQTTVCKWIDVLGFDHAQNLRTRQPPVHDIFVLWNRLPYQQYSSSADFAK